MMKLPISAMIVGLNEAHLLVDVFPTITFCDEIMYVDLGSTDNSVELAKQYRANVIMHPKVPSAEWINAEFASRTKHDWILITDPDEIIDPALVKEIKAFFEQDILPEDVGAILAPWQFYFKKTPLKGTAWGGQNRRVVLANRNRFDFIAKVHASRRLKEKYRPFTIENKGQNVIHHYWMQGYGNLFKKHLRYLKVEGESRYQSGQRTNLVTIILMPFKAFRSSFYIKKGYKDGFLGVFLSAFWAWYQTAASIRLYRRQNKA